MLSVGSLSSNDAGGGGGGGSENAPKRITLNSFKLYRVYLDLLNFSISMFPRRDSRETKLNASLGTSHQGFFVLFCFFFVVVAVVVMDALAPYLLY